MNWKELLSQERFGAKKKNAGSPFRSEFEVDFDRLIFSQPFRRLQDKTQVFPLPEQDFVHTRLTHSLEVSSVGRSLGKNAGAVILERHPDLDTITPYDFGAITGAASLAHDVGNPPFGHAGEAAISDFFDTHEVGRRIRDSVTDSEWHDLTRFEGNAQGFRLLIRNNLQGLNITKATLGAFTKYPRPSFVEKKAPNRKSQKKYGFFQSEKKEFEELAETLQLRSLTEDSTWCRHPLAFLVEAADDICYNIIDLEDGFGLGLVTYDEAEQFLAQILQDRFQPEKLKSIPGKQEKIGVLRAVAIQVLVQQSTDAFLENEKAILSGAFDKALTDNIPATPALNAISAFSVDRIYRSRQVLEKEAAGFEVISGLLESFAEAVFLKLHSKNSFSHKHKSIYRLLPDYTKYKLEEKPLSVYESMLLVTDFISGLTDSTALSIFRTIKGIAFQGNRRS